MERLRTEIEAAEKLSDKLRSRLDSYNDQLFELRIQLKATQDAGPLYEALERNTALVTEYTAVCKELREIKAHTYCPACGSPLIDEADRYSCTLCDYRYMKETSR